MVKFITEIYNNHLNHMIGASHNFINLEYPSEISKDHIYYEFLKSFKDFISMYHRNGFIYQLKCFDLINNNQYNGVNIDDINFTYDSNYIYFTIEGFNSKHIIHLDKDFFDDIIFSSYKSFLYDPYQLDNYRYLEHLNSVRDFSSIFNGVCLFVILKYFFDVMIFLLFSIGNFGVYKKFLHELLMSFEDD